MSVHGQLIRLTLRHGHFENLLLPPIAALCGARASSYRLLAVELQSNATFLGGGTPAFFVRALTMLQALRIAMQLNPVVGVYTYVR